MGGTKETRRSKKKTSILNYIGLKVEHASPFLEETKDVLDDIKQNSNHISDNLSAISV